SVKTRKSLTRHTFGRFSVRGPAAWRCHLFRWPFRMAVREENVARRWVSVKVYATACGAIFTATTESSTRPLCVPPAGSGDSRAPSDPVSKEAAGRWLRRYADSPGVLIWALAAGTTRRTWSPRWRDQIPHLRVWSADRTRSPGEPRGRAWQGETSIPRRRDCTRELRLQLGC